ncbi:hypothetical protein EVAR_10792_1 [Eumeta japonica]|uniref:Uncharacterized protein n=1 Tax=Eumeta variegata TaxID=151549 RepID=A0A4C1W9M1_EUMVA|nr:hypothetical protein EVAR_10792_1 [Eumeta japonica]
MGVRRRQQTNKIEAGGLPSFANTIESGSPRRRSILIHIHFDLDIRAAGARRPRPGRSRAGRSAKTPRELERRGNRSFPRI